MEVYTTDHGADLSLDLRIPNLKWLYADIKELGFSSVRTDWRMDHIVPNEEDINYAQLERYIEAIKGMLAVGLKPPMIVISSIPGWVYQLYRLDKKEFFKMFKRFVEILRSHLETIPGERIPCFQVLNEINTRIYCKLDRAYDILELWSITRSVLKKYNPEAKFMATLFCGNLASLAGTDIVKFLDLKKGILEHFDIVGVDYYPGMLHLPTDESGFSRKRMFGNLNLLRQVFEMLSGWDIEYELGEVGACSDWPWGSERKQKQFYKIFFPALIEMLREFKAEGWRLPSRIGIYQAIDEEKKGFLPGLRNRILWEHGMGLFKSDGRPKLVTKHDRSGESTISRIIKDLREIN